MASAPTKRYGVVGWREWVEFPEFSGARVKAKVDTGARTSAIHAEKIRLVSRDGTDRVAFVLHPNQDDRDLAVPCEAPLVERRVITDSGGHEEERYVISALVQLGEHVWPIELSLTDRDTMGFRMLLGRTALDERFLVQPWKSYLRGQPLQMISG